MARRFGFRGGLVPGVTISAYLIHPAVVSWGLDFLNRGYAHVRVTSPLYDGEIFNVLVDEEQAQGYVARLLRPDGSVSANAEVSLPAHPALAPVRRGDSMAEKGFVGPVASMETWQHLQQEGCLAFRFRWGEKHRMQSYVKDAALMPSVHRGPEALANMGYILGISNWVLAGNAYMNPWVHLETRSQNYRAIPQNTSIIAEMSVVDYYEKKGHEFVDADIALFDESDDACLNSISLRAIYKLRGA